VHLVLIFTAALIMIVYILYYDWSWGDTWPNWYHVYSYFCSYNALLLPLCYTLWSWKLVTDL